MTVIQVVPLAQPAPRLVTMPCNGAWQPVYPAFQYRENIAEFLAFPSRYLVALVWPDGDETIHSGRWWDVGGAKTFATSASNGDHPRAEVREVETYWYLSSWGTIPFGEPGFVEVPARPAAAA